jgi:plasmid stabilization system protein ParE
VKLRYTLRAARQIERALDDIAQESPQGVASVRSRILAIATLLQQHPLAGRATSRPGARRISLTPYPYFISYRVADDEIIIQRFRHAARKPLPD